MVGSHAPEMESLVWDASCDFWDGDSFPFQRSRTSQSQDGGGERERRINGIVVMRISGHVSCVHCGFGYDSKRVDENKKGRLP